MTRSTAQALAELTDRVDRTPGWTVVRQRKGSGVTVRAPGGEAASFNMDGSGSYSKVPNIRARLKRMGWDPTAADRARVRDSRRRLERDRDRAAEALARAQQEGERRAHAEQLAKARTALAEAEAGLRAARIAMDRAEDTHRRAAGRLAALETRAAG